jgi:hypothetical protein
MLKVQASCPISNTLRKQNGLLANHPAHTKTKFIPMTELPTNSEK